MPISHPQRGPHRRRAARRARWRKGRRPHRGGGQQRPAGRAAQPEEEGVGETAGRPEDERQRRGGVERPVPTDARRGAADQQAGQLCD